MIFDFTDEEVLLVAAGTHFMKHFAVDESPTDLALLELRKKLIAGLPESAEDLQVAPRIGEFCMNFLSCAYCEQIREAHASIIQAMQKMQNLQLAEALEGDEELLSLMRTLGQSQQPII